MIWSKIILFLLIAAVLLVANLIFRKRIDKICQTPETDAASQGTSAVKEDFAKAGALLEQENEKFRKLDVIAREKRTAERLQEIKDRKEQEEIMQNLSKPKPEPTPEEIEEMLRMRKEEAERCEKRKQEREKEDMERKILERHRKRELEKAVRQDLIDRGLLYGEQTKRPPIPREVVDAVYKRDGGRCVFCGSTENLQLDHIVPFSKGGATSVENLQLLCQKCNLEKSNHIG